MRSRGVIMEGEYRQLICFKLITIQREGRLVKSVTEVILWRLASSQLVTFQLKPFILSDNTALPFSLKEYNILSDFLKAAFFSSNLQQQSAKCSFLLRLKNQHLNKKYRMFSRYSQFSVSPSKYKGKNHISVSQLIT